MIDEPAKAVKGHCPNCGPDRLADVVAHHQSQYEYEGEIEYRILRCRGCEAVYFQRDSEDIVVDPKTGEDFSLPYNNSLARAFEAKATRLGARPACSRR